MKIAKLHIITLLIFVCGNLYGQSTVALINYKGTHHNPCEFIAKTDSLIYRVNFQNIGTGPAENVAILDTLDANIDVSSILTFQASHSYEFTLLQPNIALWAFKNINLPDSATDPFGSNGFV